MASPPRTSHAPLARYRRVAFVALTFLWLIVITGATVRLTGSGLGCPDWPSCHGSRPVPALEIHQLVEFLNRMVAFPTLLAAVWAAVAGWRLVPQRRDLRIASSLAVAGVLGQIVLGGLTVRFDLHPLLVSAHFALSMLILASATFAWQSSGVPSRVRMRAKKHWSLAVVVLPVAAAVIAAGILTTASGPHSGAEPGSPIERIAHGSMLVEVHARGAYVFAVLVVVLTLLARRSQRGVRDLLLLTGLIAVQITLGETQYRNGLPWQIVLGHVATAGLIWITTCRITFASAFTMDGPLVVASDTLHDAPQQAQAQEPLT